MPFIYKLVRRLSASRFLATLALGATVACGQDALTNNTETDVEIVDIDVTPKAASLAPEQQQKFTARGITAVGSSVATTVVWEATGGSIDQQGTFTATDPGDFRVVATHSVRTWLSDSVSAMVTATEQPLQLWPNEVAIPVNSTLEFRAFRLAAGGDTTDVDVTWQADGGFIESTGPGRGLYTADDQAGNHTITVTAEGGETASAEVDVTDVRVASIAILPSSASVLRGATRQLEAITRDANGTVLANRHVTWSSSNPSVAAITSDGLVVGVSTGSAQITASSEGESAQASVSVSETPVASVSVTPSTVNLVSGQTAQLNATPRDANGNPLVGRGVTWSSNNASVATVDQAGVVTAVGAGSTTIVATSEGATGTASVSVTVAPVTSVTVSPQTLTVFVGRTAQLGATLRDEAGNVLTGRTVTWSSSNSQVATVNQNGLVTSVAVGTATITATSEGQSGTASFTASNVAVGSVQVAPSSATLEEGETLQLSATVRATTGEVLTGRVVVWSSSNSQVAQVNSSGVVTAAGVGNATITATSEGQSATSAVAVTQVPVATVQVTPGNVSLTIGQGRNLSATPRDEDGNTLTGRSVAWTTSNASVASVNQQGRVTAVGIGTATVTATIEGVQGTASITVSQVPVASVTVSPSSATLEPGETQDLTATPSDAGGNPLSGRSISWSTSNASVATVNQQGTVTAVAAGSATITATSEGQSGTAAITVVQPVASVDVTPSSFSIDVGQAQTLTATPRDANGNALSGRTISWSTSGAGVATVDGNGRVTGVGAGTATITATSEGQSGTASVTVTAVPSVVTSVDVTPSAFSLTVGGSRQLQATVRDQNGNLMTGQTVSWSASPLTVATVNVDGVVLAVAPGTGTITATVSGVSGSAAVTITQQGSYLPPDIFDHDFANGSSGGLFNGNGQPFIENTGWNYVQNSGDPDEDWRSYVERVFNGPVDDGGEAFFLRPSVGGTKDLYIAIKAEFTGIVARGNNSKWLRFQSFSVSGGFIGGMGYNANGGQWQFDFNNLGSGWEYTMGRRSGQSLAPADLENQRFTFEVHVEYGLSGNAARITLWVNGEQVRVSRSYVAPGTFDDIYMDAAILAGAGQSWSNGGPNASGVRFDQFQFDGTTDLSSGTGAMRIARIAVSTTRIGWGAQ